MSEQLKKPSFSGYLQVKRPADQRYTLLRSLSSWKKRLVTVLLDELQDDNQTINIVKILLGKKQVHLENQNMLANQADEHNLENKKNSKDSRNRIILKSNNCVIYRCRSRKEAHAFVLANQNRPLLYLAAPNEILCQFWIKTLRDALCPPIVLQNAIESKQQVFPVSLVDNEYSFRANLIGIYGYLCFDQPHKLVLRNSQNGTLIQDWTLDTVSMRLVGEAADQSFALIERVSLNDEHVFVELNSDFVPNHIDQDEIINQKKEQMASDCNLILMNCSMDSSTGPGLINFFSENAYHLVKKFKEEKRKFLTNQRRKELQIANENHLLIEDLIADRDEQTEVNSEDFGEKLNKELNGKLNEIINRKLSNAFLNPNNNESNDDQNKNLEEEENKSSRSYNQQDDNSTVNLEELIEDQYLDESNEFINEQATKEKIANKIPFDHKLPFHASTSELLDSTNINSSFEKSIEQSSDSEMSTD